MGHINERLRVSVPFMFFSELANCRRVVPSFFPVRSTLICSESARAPRRRLSVIPMTNATKDESDMEQSLSEVVIVRNMV